VQRIRARARHGGEFLLLHGPPRPSVYDLKQRLIGRVRDAALVPLIHPARIDRYLVARVFVALHSLRPDFSHLAERHPALERKALPYHSDEYMLRIQRDLLDQQIIDVNGRKVVRVTDVSLEKTMGEHESLMILEVDVGVRSILRRLLQGVVPRRWIRRLQQPISPNSIRWSSVISSKPTRCGVFASTSRTTNWSACTRGSGRHRRGKLGPAEREAIFETMDSEVAAETLSEIDPEMQADILESLEPEVARISSRKCLRRSCPRAFRTGG